MRSPRASAGRPAPDGPPSSELALAEGLRDALVLLDADWRVTFLNARARASVASVGLVPTEMIGRSIWASFPALEHSAAADELRRARTAKNPVHFEHHETANARWYELDAMLLGDVMAVYWRDVSEQRRLEAHLRAAQKMEAVGRLAGGVAHDFNNLLTAIKGFASLLQMTIAPSDESHEFVAEIVKASDRAAGLTNQLLAFSRRQLRRPERIDINARVRDLERMLGLLVSEGGELELRLDPSLGLVHADPGQLEQIVLNLAVNARDAIAGRPDGKITIATSSVVLCDEFRRWRVAPAPGEYVRLDVRDNGVGMDAATQARIFDPFFSTKAVGQGTGLGLATVYGIAKQSGGYVWVQSAPGEGSTFSVYLPRASANTTASDDDAHPLRHGDLVLLVEDEDGVRRVARRALELHGYRVIEAADGARAVELARATPSIGLLITDVMMPGMLGPELAGAVREIVPGLPVLYMSGHADEAARGGLLDSSTPFLAKPFSADSLVEKVREVLEAPRR
ncbi:MAG TPA: ATP-binding protein [Gemmatimonadaceae bacterium]|nr:ATP-binding protein [Gemmatimonadaceae bacterium]